MGLRFGMVRLLVEQTIDNGRWTIKTTSDEMLFKAKARVITTATLAKIIIEQKFFKCKREF